MYTKRYTVVFYRDDLREYLTTSVVVDFEDDDTGQLSTDELLMMAVIQEYGATSANTARAIVNSDDFLLVAAFMGDCAVADVI